MAPYKIRLKLPATPPPLLSAARITKTRSKAATDTVKSVAARVAPTNSSNCVKRYNDGILNLEWIPSHLVEVARQNAADSPLLRLPPEIRDRIWGYAMGGHLVILPCFQPSSGFAVRPEFQNSSHRSHAFQLGPDSERFKMPVAFHLPEVCRQIYSEAALTAYRQNIFLLADGSGLRLLSQLMVAQHRAIESVSVGAEFLMDIMNDYSWVRQMATSIPPNLSYILVTAAALECSRLNFRNTSRRISDNLWQTKVLQRLMTLFGGGIRIEVEN